MFLQIRCIDKDKGQKSSRFPHLRIAWVWSIRSTAAVTLLVDAEMEKNEN